MLIAAIVPRHGPAGHWRGRARRGGGEGRAGALDGNTQHLLAVQCFFYMRLARCFRRRRGAGAVAAQETVKRASGCVGVSGGGRAALADQEAAPNITDNP